MMLVKTLENGADQRSTGIIAIRGPEHGPAQIAMTNVAHLRHNHLRIIVAPEGAAIEHPEALGDGIAITDIAGEGLEHIVIGRAYPGRHRIGIPLVQTMIDRWHICPAMP